MNCEREQCRERATHNVVANGKSVACCHNCACILASLVAKAGSRCSIEKRKD